MFMVPMRAEKSVEPLHEPPLTGRSRRRRKSYGGRSRGLPAEASERRWEVTRLTFFPPRHSLRALKPLPAGQTNRYLVNWRG